MTGDGKRPEFEKITIRQAFEDYQKTSKPKKNQVSNSVYRSIIKKFFMVYMNELFFMKETMYFPFMGKATINRCGGWIRQDQSNNKVAKLNILKKVENSVGIYWYNRPLLNMKHIRLKKMKGSTGALPQIENEWKKFNDAGSLPTTTELFKRGQRTLKIIK